MISDENMIRRRFNYENIVFVFGQYMPQSHGGISIQENMQ